MESVGSPLAFELLTVCVFGLADGKRRAELRLHGCDAVEADGFKLHFYDDDGELSRILVEIRPQVLISFGSAEAYENLWRAPLEVRKRWLNFADSTTEPGAVAEAIVQAFVVNATTRRLTDEPLISVFTPTYKTGKRIERAYRSLEGQSYRNWEWVVYDDSPDNGETFAELTALCRRDHRISAFRAERPSGVIGEVKRRACGLARGEILLELDHDDELTRDALSHVVEAFRRFPDAGFFYTDWAEVFEDGRNASYGEGWGFGFGSYREEAYEGRSYLVSSSPSINAKTIRHIVSAPNHLRAWTRAAYTAAGGHNPHVHVCDDYELCVRTFLSTRMVHIKRLGYVQYLDAAGQGNTQRVRNKEIQRLTRYFRQRYDAQIHARFLELGVDDYIWQAEGRLDWERENPVPTPAANYVYE